MLPGVYMGGLAGPDDVIQEANTLYFFFCNLILAFAVSIAS